MPSKEEPKPQPRKRRLKALRPPRSAEATYRKKLARLTAEVERDIKQMILPLMHQRTADSKTVDANENFLTVFTQNLAAIRHKYDSLQMSFESLANEFAGQTNSESKKKFNTMLKSTMGEQVDLVGILAEEGVSDFVAASSYENSRLIKSVPEKYLDRVQGLVMNNFAGGKVDKGLEGQIFNILRKDIRALGPKAKKRAKLIARDQTAKLNASITQVRQTNLGIEEYEWVDSRDSRVRGNPGGKYPNVPNSRNHWKRHGKIFKWNKPPPDGHPGQAVNCRCVAIPIIPKKASGGPKKEKSFDFDESDIYIDSEAEIIEEFQNGTIDLRTFNKKMKEIG